MVVQHNLQAMNANRMLGITTSMQAKTTEKLSSGYRVNRAADDAAGLSISEKMRKQIRGLDQASNNAQDGISAVQTAEGALGEVHDMLQRMNELAVQAANGTNSESDRKAIQNEIDQLTTEIDRVAETTKFNETYLLKGDPNASDATNPATKDITFKLQDAGIKGVWTDDGTDTTAPTKYTFTATEMPQNDGDKIMVAGEELTLDNVNGDGMNTYTSTQITAKILTALSGANSNGTAKLATGDITDNNDGTFEVAAGKVPQTTVPKELSFNLHVGADADMTNKIGVKIDTMNSTLLGIKGISVVDENNEVGGTTATYAIDVISDALQKVSDQRSALGAVQNRLEHTIKNLDNVVENTQAAESQIRDTDMAETMVQYTKNNILAQAGQSMLAQANQSTQGVMSLLQ